jgi:hypothetical protein
LTVTQRRLIQVRTAEMVRCEKLLEDAHLKLSPVISDIHGVSGRAARRRDRMSDRLTVGR